MHPTRERGVYDHNAVFEKHAFQGRGRNGDGCALAQLSHRNFTIVAGTVMTACLVLCVHDIGVWVRVFPTGPRSPTSQA